MLNLLGTLKVLLLVWDLVAGKVPYLHMCTLAGRVGKDVTLCLPVESSVDEDGPVVEDSRVSETRQVAGKIPRNCIFCT